MHGRGDGRRKAAAGEEGGRRCTVGLHCHERGLGAVGRGHRDRRFVARGADGREARPPAKGIRALPSGVL